MADDKRLPSNLQTALLGVLVFDRAQGAVVAEAVHPGHFDPSHRPLAEAVLRYRRQYNAPPGAAQLASLAQEAGQVSRRLLEDIEAEASSLNPAYVASRAQQFVRRQVLKQALMDAGERYSGTEDNLTEEVEAILYKALRFRSQTLDAGVFLNDPKRALTFLDQQSQEGYYPVGIRELDRLGIGMRLQETILYIAPKGSGKSWWCIHCGRQALMQGASVAHVSLEMGVPNVIQRYFQSFFSVAKRPDRVLRSVLELDDLDRFVDFSLKYERPALDLGHPQIRKVLREKQKEWGARFGGLVVQAFPTGYLTLEGLVNYLDYLESSQRFRPHVLIVDYPDLMSLNRANYRLELNALYEQLRGLCVQRNMAGVTPTQSSREGLSSRQVRSDMASEGMGKVNSADNVLTYSRTKAEARLGLARLNVAHARNEEGGANIILSQSYSTGQYVIQSALLPPKQYWDRVNEESGDQDKDD